MHVVTTANSFKAIVCQANRFFFNLRVKNSSIDNLTGRSTPTKIKATTIDVATAKKVRTEGIKKQNKSSFSSSLIIQMTYFFSNNINLFIICEIYFDI